MAASTRAIEMQLASPDESTPAEYSATAYYACLQDMMSSWIECRRKGQVSPIQIESLAYCYSAIVSMLDLGVISN